MGAHLIDGQFQSDKYPTCPRGKVPLAVTDKSAQDLLWLYAQRHRAIDATFSDDLEAALEAAGYKPPVGNVIEMAVLAATGPENAYTTHERFLARGLLALMHDYPLLMEMVEHERDQWKAIAETVSKAALE